MLDGHAGLTLELVVSLMIIEIFHKTVLGELLRAKYYGGLEKTSDWLIIGICCRTFKMAS